MKTSPKARRAVADGVATDGQLKSLDFVRATLESVQTNLFLADPQLTIVYANKRALDTLRGMAGEIRKAFGVEVEQIVGGSIHRFHRDKQAVERILRTPSALPHKADFTFGAVTLQ